VEYFFENMILVASSFFIVSVLNSAENGRMIVVEFQSLFQPLPMSPQ
jgi:hypothetical protein